MVDGPLTSSEIEAFHRDGFLVAKSKLPSSIIEAVQQEIEEVVDEAATKLYAEGKLTDLHSDSGFLHRAAKLWEQCPEITSIVASEVGFPQSTPRRPTAGKAFFGLLTAPPLLAMMRQILESTEVYVSGVYRLRPKLPAQPNGVVPWHQDQCFFAPCSDAQPTPLDWSECPPVISAWVPLMNATMEAGGMQMIKPAQATLHRHYQANVTAPSTTLHPDCFPANIAVVDAPAMIGDVLLFSAYTPHRSIENSAGLMRWAADIRYNVPDAGDYYPREGGFLGCSSNPDADVVSDWRECVSTSLSTTRCCTLLRLQSCE